MFSNLAEGKGSPLLHFCGNSNSLYSSSGMWLNSAQNALLYSRGNNGDVYMPHCYVAHTLPVVLYVIFMILPLVECLWNFYIDLTFFS